MNELIRIEARELSGATVQTCNARDLWAFVESKQEFANWIKSRIEKYGFIEGEDFTVDKFINGRAKVIDYHITIETAKELAMVENNDKGRLVRRYFIECERMAKSKSSTNPANLSRLQLLEMAMQAEQERLALEHKVEVLEPKAVALDRIADADGAMNITNTAKSLQVQPKKLFSYMREKRWIYRRPGGSGNVAYQDKIQTGYLAHKVTTIQRDDGSEKVVEQVLVTPKGLAKLARVFSQ